MLDKIIKEINFDAELCILVETPAGIRLKITGTEINDLYAIYEEVEGGEWQMVHSDSAEGIVKYLND